MRSLWEGVRPGRDVGVPFGAGLLCVLCFPAPTLWWLAPVALVPGFVWLLQAPSPRSATWRAWMLGTGYLTGLTHWLTPNVGPALLLFTMLLGAMFIPLAAAARARPAMGAVMAPALWVLAEVVRAWDRLGGPWGLFGTSQWNSPLLPLAGLGGAWLISAWLVAVNWSLATAWVRRSPVAIAGAGALTVVAIAAVALSPAPEVTGEMRVTVVQPGPDLDARTRLDRQLDLTAPIGDTDLVVWGESSVGIGIDPGPAVIAEIAAGAEENGTPILVNLDARRGPGGIFKSSTLIGPEGARGSYDKMRLVPFGEYIPFRSVLGWTAAISEAAAEDRRRGDELRTFDVGPAVIGVVVCFETAFPDMSRTLARMGAEILIGQSATSTFQESWAPAQHAALGAVRAVETGRSFVHATLTGQSAVFDPRGDRLESLSASETGAITAEVPIARGETPYVRFGDWVPALSAIVVAAAALILLLRRITRR